MTPVRRMSHDIFDHPIGAAGTREIRDDRERAARNERARGEATEVFDSRVGKCLRPHCIGNRLGWRWIVALVQVCVQAEQLLELILLDFADVHARPDARCMHKRR